MATLLKDSSSTDSYGKNILWSDSIKQVLFYSAADESWDRTGGGAASWYIENTLPYDTFDGSSLDEDKWSFFDYRGSVSGTLNDHIHLTISGSDARGGITSSGKWKLSGDFDIRLYFDESSYYNEYRGDSATGLTVSVDDSNKVRISKFFDRSVASIGYASHHVQSYPLKYIGWTQDAYNTSVGEDTVTCLRLVRESSGIKSYVSTPLGFTELGTGVDGSTWSEDVDVEIEVETSQYNFYESKLLGFSVSGTLASPSVFSTARRGAVSEFPGRALVVVDGAGMSILDEEEMSLWMRFSASEDYMFKDVNGRISAANGKVCYTTSSGVICLDFANDKAVWFTSSSKREASSGLALRNFKSVFYSVDSSSFVLDNNVLDLNVSFLDGHEFLAVATDSGVGLLIDGSDEKVEDTPEGGSRRITISSFGDLYWNYYDSSSSSGKLFYRESVQNLVSDPSSTFTYTDYYSTNTSIPLSSEQINDISFCYNDSNLVLLSHGFGIDYISVEGKVLYGPLPITNVFQDPYFANNVGVYWGLTTISLFNVFDVFVTGAWATKESNSVKLTLEGTGFVYIGNYSGISQEVNLTGVDKVYYDLKLVNSSPSVESNYIDFQVVVNDTVLASYTDAQSSFTSLDNYVDVSSYSGNCFVRFLIVSRYDGEVVTYNSFYVDNIRVIPVEPDYAIIPTMEHDIKESLLVKTGSSSKIFFAASDGYGAIDVDSNTLDYFYNISVVVPVSYVLSAEYVEYVDEV